MNVRTYCTTIENPLINPSHGGYANVPEFITDPLFQNQLAEYITIKYGSYVLSPLYQQSPDLLKNDITTLYLTNKYKYQTLFDTMGFDYNPINNYDMIEKEDIENSGTDTDTSTIGEISGNETLGSATDTVAYGQRQDTTTHSVSPMETTTFTPESQDAMAQNARQDTTTTGERINNYTTQAHTDTMAKDYGHKMSRTLTRSGNIGITTTQQMLMSQRDVANFSIYAIIAKDIMRMSTIRLLYCK